MSDLINRPQYIERIAPFMNKSIIKVLTGQRRVGKSFMLRQLIQRIQLEKAKSNIIYIDKELETFDFIKTHNDLNDYVISKLHPEKPNYLFVDEIQEIESFEKCLRSLLNQELCDIYCTGSNANMLSGELATALAGRHITFQIHGLSYIEFLHFNGLENNSQNLNQYLTLGGMPYLRHLGLDKEIVFEYLQSLYNTILLRDVVKRENIRNVTFLENLITYLAEHTGSLFSSQNISKYLKSQQINLPTQSVINYINALANAFFIHRVLRSDITGLKVFEVGEKYYFEDLGIRNCIRTFNLSADVGKIMENAVYLHLLRNDFEVWVGKTGEKEVDFIAQKKGERMYIQVAYILQDEKTIQREFGNLAYIQDQYPKFVISMDEFSALHSWKGIRRLHLREFLSMEINDVFSI